jgi:hypothetical protein
MLVVSSSHSWHGIIGKSFGFFERLLPLIGELDVQNPTSNLHIAAGAVQLFWLLTKNTAAWIAKNSSNYHSSTHARTDYVSAFFGQA